jgi:type VI secretion system secreted protein VgrG
MLPTDRQPVTIDGTDVPLVLNWMIGHEELGRLFEYEIEILCEKFDVNFNEILGKPLTVCVSKFMGVRFFHGIVTRLWRVGVRDRYLVLRATLSPRLWLLTRTTDCRIYQHLTVPEVVEKVLNEHHITVSGKRLASGDYKKWDYLTQYRESTFAFLSRIMEREGIYYYFKHTKADHEIILSDSLSCHDAVEGYDPIAVGGDGTSADRDHLTGWRMIHRVTSGASALQAHDFRLGRTADIKAVKKVSGEHDNDKLELYDYAGHYVGSQNEEKTDSSGVRASGEHYAMVLLDEQRTELEQVEGEGTARGVEVGALFHIEDLDAPTDPLLVISTRYEVHNPETQSGAAAEDVEVCKLSFSAMNSSRQFRPAQSTAKAMAAGPETATVVGSKGAEILTDPYGRVRIQFHWDREGKSNEASTCWVRVGQAWAGAQWGTIFIPRIGHEVIVQFLGGDPDRPLITGSLYNANNMPPYTLPDNATQSGIKTRSSQGGGPNNFNEIRFEDKKGEEQLYIQAEKNKDNLVKNDESVTIGHDRVKTVGNDETVKIKGNRTETVTFDETENINKNQTITVGLEQKVTVGANQTIAVTANRSISVGSNQTETITIASAETVGAAKALTIGGGYAVTVGGAMNEAIGGAKGEEIGGAKMVAVGGVSGEKVGGNKSVTAGGNVSESAGKDVSLKAGKNLSASAADDASISAGKKGVFSAGDQLTLTCGDASIVLKKNGDITINGKKIAVTGSGDVVIKGSKVSHN